MRRFSLFTALIFLILAYSSYSDVIGNVEITADTLSYSGDGTSMEASGSVEAISADSHITADHLIYNIENKQVTADRGFTMQTKKGAQLGGEYLDYSFKTKTGTARNIKIIYRYAVMSGDQAKIDDEKIELKDSSFNMCGLEPPHYHVSSRTTTLYPDEGKVLGYWGYLWLGNFPVVPVPVYYYDFTAIGAGQKADATGVMSVPQTGSNDTDGFYIRYKIPWIASKNLSGQLTLLNTAKGGFGEGIDGNYTFNDYNDMNFRIFYDPRYDTYGGITEAFRFGPETGKEDNSLYSFFKVKKQVLLELDTDISDNEEVNYQRVSKLPNLTLKMNDVPAFFDHFIIGGSVSYGYIADITGEASDTTENIQTKEVGDSTGNIQTRGYFDIPTDIGRFSIGLGQNQTWYGLTGYWSRLTQNLRLSKDLGGGFDGYIAHMHYINFTGQSPFLYEQYLTTPSDEFYSGLGYNFGPHRFSVDYSWYVPGWDQKEFIYTLTLGFHCYAIDITYNTVMQDLRFGVSLLAR